ncbi:MAG: 2-succinyl-5-enolpyruvyl-6-hydroxy-3-cyclohexene-1-carboxylic-acid synthase [Bdellovibrio sp.]|nr:2-succinyl-5-enolpyruvyl-6-hydroxy-3-cyclohexene-1-carboxylic-acid synthase [Bdellovibrio sp.]
MTNYDLSLKVFDFLNQAQVQSVVVCAGARNAPLVMALKEQNFKIYSFFEERSASFFALGLMKSESKPVAIMTTSGTAVAELLPAAIEATYQGLPLILVTADRPKSYRGTGSPQTIEQLGLFLNYVEATHDLDVFSEQFQFEWSFKKPIHLNVCFDEPLIDQHSTGNTPKVQLKKKSLQNEVKGSARTAKKPLVILGGLDKSDVNSVIKFIQDTGAPVYAESLSQLGHSEKLAAYLVNSSDVLVKKLFQNKLCDSVIRIGSVPTLRFWRDLESEFSHTPVTHFSNLAFSGLARDATMYPINALNEILIETEKDYLSPIKKLDQALQNKKLALLAKYPNSEPSLVACFSEVIANEPIYLGNSLPIRHWDQFSLQASKEVYANRGANGIEGQVSTYLGWSEAHAKSFCLIGDLTALYDLASLGLSPQLKSAKRRVVIINNFGGQIFSRIFKNDLFLNAHQTQFKSWAAMWNWDYSLVKSKADFAQMKSDHMVVEIQPDEQQTKNFWDEWDDICRKA